MIPDTMIFCTSCIEKQDHARDEAWELRSEEIHEEIEFEKEINEITNQ